MRNLAFAAALLCAFAAQATVTGNPPPTSYACNGTSTSYVIPWPYLATSHISAVVTGIGAGTLALTTDYTVTPSLATSTGTLKLVAGSRCQNGATLTISRVVPLTQPQSFRTGNYQGSAHEQALDRAEMQIQQNAATHATDKTAQATRDTGQDAAIVGVGNSVAALNGSSQAVTSTSSVLAFGSSTPRTLTSRFADTINVKDFGATGDGVTDDTAAVQSAINQATSVGAKLFVNRGTYIVKNLSVVTAIRIEGEGRDIATLKLKALVSPDGSPILNITVSGVTVRHLGFDGNKAAQSADGFSDSFNSGTNGLGRAYRALIRAYNAGGEIVGLTVEDCRLQNAYGGAVATQNASHVKVRRNISTGNNFETAILYSTTAAGGATYYAGDDVSDNDISNTASGDASVNGNAIILNHATEFIVANNSIKNTERSGLKCEGSKNGVVQNNVIDGITLGFAGIQLQQDAANIILQSNKMSNVGSGINNGFVTGSLGYFNILINGNSIDTTLDANTPDGIAFTFPSTPQSSNIIITNNVMRAIARKGINFAGGAWMDATISGNNIKTTSGGTNNQSGIDVRVDTAGTTGLTMTGNLVDLNSAVSGGAAISIDQFSAQTLARAVITGNTVINQAGRTTITDGNVAMITSGVFGGNSTDGFIRMGSTGLQSIAPSASSFSAGYQFGGIQPTATTFANIGTPANGTILYCSDCTIASPCAGAGTGAIAKRLAGVWVCN